MIKLHRPASPSIFNTKRFIQAKEDLWQHFKKKTQQRFSFKPEVLNSIRQEIGLFTHDKCAYCESRIGTSSVLVIDHFRPRGGCVGNDKKLLPYHYFWLAYEWENMLPTCQNCNNNKSNIFPIKNEKNRAKIGAELSELILEKPLLIDPCQDNPDEHLVFLESGELLGKTKRGVTTIDVIGLNRVPLVNARRNAINDFKYRLKLNDLSVSYLANLLSDSPKQEYSGFLRSIFNQHQLSLIGKTSDVDKIKKGISKIKEKDLRLVNDLVPYKRFNRFTIKTIEIKNFRSIKYLNLSFKPSDTLYEREPWMLLLGDNGVGKTSILQGIALALCGKKQFDKLGIDPKDYLRDKSNAGYVKITNYESADEVRLSFTKNGFEGINEDPLSILIGYGATRLLPKGDLKHQLPTDGSVNINNLFSYSAALSDVHTWLKGVTKTEFDQKIAPAFFDLLDLREDEKVTRSKNGKLRIKYCNGSYDLEKTSDGYQTIVALACDIMKTLSSDPSGYHSVNGIVLIDELGNHLHPRWRMKIVGALRKTFPKLQFIVSTHEPLCLRGVLKGEAVVLATDDNREVFSIDEKLLPDHTLMRVDELLTSDFFGLINVFDSETQKKFDEYYRLLTIPKEKRTDQDTKKIHILTRHFAGKEMNGSSPRVQAVYEIVNEKFATKLLDSDFKAKEELKKETIDEVRSILDINNLGWL